MSHEITIREDGFAEAAYSMQPAWHGLGTVFDHAMSSSEALTAAGLDWEVRQEDVYRRTDPEIPQEYICLDNIKLNTRSDNDVVLGMVSDHYQVIQNVEAFQFLDALVEEHEMKFESAFSLYGGKKVVLLAQMPGVETIAKDDHILPYILMSLGHDGTESIRFGPVAMRVVCANTYAIANEEKGVSSLSIQHRGNIQEKLDRARGILGLASTQFAQYAEIGSQLAEYKLSKDDWMSYLNIMCPELNPLDPDHTPRRAKKLQETRDEIINCFCNERQQLEGIGKSAWAAYNAVVEHIDHLPRRGATRQRKAEARFNVCLYGAGRDMKERALATACRFAGIETV